MTKLIANKVTYEVNGASIIQNITVSLKPGELVVILGPNGAGKTSLLRALMGLIKIKSGTVELNNISCHDMPPEKRALLVSYLPQYRPLLWPNRVIDIVSLGRFAYGANLGRLKPVDAAAVEEALSACNLTSLAKRNALTLSGGELARVHFARAIASKTPLLLADEPIAKLDPLHQIQVANLLRQYVDQGSGAMIVLHEIPLAAQIADRLIWMKNGSIYAQGTPEETLTSEMMNEIYEVKAHVAKDNYGIDIRLQGISKK